MSSTIAKRGASSVPTSLLCIGALLAALGSCGRASERPHLVLISIDTLRADRVGLYGYERDTTPRLDAFFAQGSVLEQAVASSPCTVPSVRQFLTGRLERDPDGSTLAETLRHAGYRTAAIVSQHQFVEPGAWPYARGFEHFDVQDTDQLDHHGMTTRTAEEVTDLALAWLGQAPADEPFFLWLHYFDPHDPYEPPSDYRAFDAGNTSTRSGDRRRDLQEERRHPEEPWQRAGYVFSPEDVRHLRNLYDGETRFTDAQIGRVLDALEERGLVASSVVALLADHGELLGERGVWDHCLGLSEPELRVPFLLRVRGGTLGGRGRWSEPTSILDLAPTLLALAGIGEANASRPGRNLLDRERGRAVVAQWGRFRAIYRDRWKLVTDGRAHRLLDLRQDERRRTDLARSHPDVVEDLLAAGAGEPEEMRRIAAETAAEHERLRSLGYLE